MTRLEEAELPDGFSNSAHPKRVVSRIDLRRKSVTLEAICGDAGSKQSTKRFPHHVSFITGGRDNSFGQVERFLI